MDQEKKAQELVQEAEKKLQGGKGLFGGLFGSGSRNTDDAIELYIRAANMFKMAKKWTQAGECFSKAAELHLKNGSKHDSASCYVDASTCFKKQDTKESVTCLSTAIDLYQEMGRFSIAAKHNQAIAEILEADGDLKGSMQYYEKAAELFKGEESNAAANKAWLKVAAHAAMEEDYGRATRVYEEIAASSLESSLLKYSAKEYFFRSALCHLCVDVLNAKQAVDRYVDMYPAWQDSRECKFVKTLTQTIEDEDIDAFTEAVQEFDSISRMEQWYTTLLLRVKKGISSEGELC
jgi:alpha-soluble NSF attachment protein